MQADTIRAVGKHGARSVRPDYVHRRGIFDLGYAKNNLVVDANPRDRAISSTEFMQTTVLEGVEINPKIVGAIFTDIVGESLRVFCLYVNGDTFQCVVPAQENQQNIATIFAQLDMPDNCTSLIAERMVQGRLYAQDDKAAWMYTLLATDGSRSPGLSSHLHRLAWKCVWRTPNHGGSPPQGPLGQGLLLRCACRAHRGGPQNSLAKYHPLTHPLLPQTKRTLPIVTLSLFC